MDGDVVWGELGGYDWGGGGVECGASGGELVEFEGVGG